MLEHNNTPREEPAASGGPAASPFGQQQMPEPAKPEIQFKVSATKMELEMTMTRPEGDVLPLDPAEVLAAIGELGVVYGVNEEAVKRLCQNPVYGQAHIVARGTPPKRGRDGYIHYLIQTKRELRPRVRDDDTVDYRDLGFIQNVTRLQPLAEIHAQEKGGDGRDVLGEVLEGAFGTPPPSVAGVNTELSEDGTMLLASCDGNVDVRRGIIHIVDVMRISGNVDNATGHVDFIGDVIISGDVLSGFRVTSGGSIVVWGGVEGAVLEAKGDISINEGVNGMNQGSLKAGGSIRCRYIQACTLEAGADIYADSILYSTLQCGGNVELRGRRGTLVGGRTSLGGYLKVKTIGSSSHVPTAVLLFANLEEQQEIERLEEEIKGIDQEHRKLQQILARFEQMRNKGQQLNRSQVSTIELLRNNFTQLAENRQRCSERLAELRQDLVASSGQVNYIECTGRVHVGSQLSFGPLVTLVNQSFVFSRVSVINGEIVISPLGPG